MRNLSKIAVIVYGPPGSGKGTQAELLARKFDLIHFDTGRYLERIVHDPKNKKNPEIQRERKNFDTGILLTPLWVLGMASQKVKEIAAAGWGLILSGSPRTVFETFGDEKRKGLIKILEELYGRSHIFVFQLKARPETSIRRNSQRMICTNCGQGLMGFYSEFKKDQCPFCAAPLRKRTLDNPETIKVRLKEFKERTDPIFSGLKKRGYKIHIIDAEAQPYEIFTNISKFLK